jgi:hypothetical protein
MELFDSHVLVALAVDGYEFPHRDKGPADAWWDRNWLQVRGHVRVAGHSWAFLAPCLLTSEARTLADWLDDVARHRVPAVPEGRLARAWSEHEGALVFLEPALGFSLQETDGAAFVVRVHLAHEAADPLLPDDDRLAEPPPFVRVRLTPQQLIAAADDWRDELRAWPVRD